MDLELADKGAIVTGGSRGIGKAVAASFLREGLRVVIGARDPVTLEAARVELSRHRGEIHSFSLDTADPESITRFVDQAQAVLGGIDVLVNSAARPSGQRAAPRLQEVTAAEFHADFDVKVLGYLRMIGAVVPFMVERDGGRIINVDGLGTRMTGSVLGSMRNAAVAALTKNAADELGSVGITVTGVSPGMVRTEATPAVLSFHASLGGVSVEDAESKLTSRYALGRMVTADEVASIVTFLASPRSVAVNGDIVPCGGGVRGSIYY